MRNKKLFVCSVVAVVLLLVVESYIYLNVNSSKKKDVKISFVVTGDNLDKWENMRAGAETAAMDNDCIVDFVNCPVEYGVDGEIDTISRQLSDGADYVMVASSDYESVKEFVNTNHLSSRVLFVKNGNPTDYKNAVIPDDYSLGIDFANYIKENSTVSKLAMVSTTEDVNTLAMMQGINEALKDMDIKIEYRHLSSKTGTINQSMYNLGQSGLFDGFITLDFNTLEAAAKAQDKLKKPVHVYSIDSSKESVYYLDSNVIDALAFKDDYSIGFLAVEEAIGEADFSKLKSSNQMYYISDRNTIHSEKMEKVLFRFDN